VSKRVRLFGLLGASLLVIAGSLILVFGIPGLTVESDSHFSYKKVSEISPGLPGFPESPSRFPIQKIDRIGISSMGGEQVLLDVAHYQDIAGHVHQALIYLPTKLTQSLKSVSVPDMNQLRWQAWLDASESFRNSTPDNTLFITWWDNAQRIHLLSGKKSWINAPVGEAFDRQQQDLWRHVSGGFMKQNTSLKQLANWLLSDAEQALETIKKTVGSTHELYFLVSIDDLARLSEMSALSAKSIPFETRIFRSDENIHRLISRVKRWAREKGGGSYLVQHLPSSGVRVWRITSAEGEKTLLARLLPFTSSLANPIHSLELVHRSEWSSYVSIYRW